MQAEELRDAAVSIRSEIGAALDGVRKSELGQFFTPWSVARFMAELPSLNQDHVRILDAGAGTGILTAAMVARACAAARKPVSIEATVFEMDDVVASGLRQTLAACADACRHAGIRFVARLRVEDYVEIAVAEIASETDVGTNGYHLAILNPPYRKLNSASRHRTLLRDVGIETSNLYAAFVSLALRQLVNDGELVAITPRSFCNGTYFRSFRRDLLSRIRLRRIHVFERRDTTFADASVLQENVIFHGSRSMAPTRVLVSASREDPRVLSSERMVPANQVVRSDDREAFIHVATDDLQDADGIAIGALTTQLRDLGIAVSTGRVVDFRAREYLRIEPSEGDAPLIYPHHMCDGLVRWPASHPRKPGAIQIHRETAFLLIPSATYVLVKRFSAKEEARRVVAAVYDPSLIPSERVGLENHLNYFHAGGSALPRNFARGLAAYLNSTPFDCYFREFSGHTQVNATDLRNVPYPSADVLCRLGEALGARVSDQALVDQALLNILPKSTRPFFMATVADASATRGLAAS